MILTSHKLMDWLGYDLDFYGIELVGPVLGSVIFLWGGWPFFEGGRREIQAGATPRTASTPGLAGEPWPSAVAGTAGVPSCRKTGCMRPSKRRHR